jgi:hypothetical protein
MTPGPAAAPQNPEAASVDKQPITRFGLFFKSYGIGLSLVIAAIPILSSQINMIPLFAGMKGPLTFLTSLGAYLLVGFIFSLRRTLAGIWYPGIGSRTHRVVYSKELRWMNGLNMLPAVLIAVSIFLFFLYVTEAETSIQQAAFDYLTPASDKDESKVPLTIRELVANKSPGQFLPALFQMPGDPAPVRVHVARASAEHLDRIEVRFPEESSIKALLAKTASTSIPGRLWLSILYFGAFSAAVSGFVLLGLKDYLQYELGLSDQELIRRPFMRAERKDFMVGELPGVRGVVEYSPIDSGFAPIVEGPYCAKHDRLLEVLKKGDGGFVTEWGHRIKQGDKQVERRCDIKAYLTELGMRDLLNEAAHYSIKGKGPGAQDAPPPRPAAPPTSLPPPPPLPDTPAPKKQGSEGALAKETAEKTQG